MLRVYECITGLHDLRFVIVAGIICLFACYTAVGLLDRSRVTEGGGRHAWLAGAAFVGGAGIWATHFVAMLALRLVIPIGYDVGLTVLSIALAIAGTWVGFSVVHAGGRAVALGGALAGLAIAGMHYLGMAAVRVPAHIGWDTGYVLASIVIGTVFGAAALQTMAVPGADPARRFRSGSLYALGIVGMHFTGMAAVSFVPDPGIPMPDEVMNPEWLAIGVAAVTVLIVALGLVGSIAARLRAHVVELEATRRRLEETTASLTVALEEAAASSQTKSQFLATMSHELRTPLNAVIGFSELIVNETFGPLGNPRYKDYAKTICDSGAHLLGLINDVLDLSRVDAGGLDMEEGEVALHGLVREGLRMVGRQAESGGVSLSAVVPVDLPRVRADERRLRQVLLNLLSNAVKFTPAGGTVQVSAAAHADGISIAVADSGIGIAPEDIPRAMERFGQVDNSLERRYEGTGLGLPLARSLIELHGGTLRLESAVGAGTTVTVTLPAHRMVEGPSCDRHVA